MSSQRALFLIAVQAFLAVVVVFLVAPLGVTAAVSITSSDFMAFPPQGFSWRWYQSIWTTTAWRRATVNSAAIGLICAAIATVLGSLSAYAITRLPGRATREAVLVFFIAPMAVPHMSLAMALYPIFAAMDLIGTRLGVALAQAIFATPFVVLSVLSVSRRRDRELEQAARTLGAGPIRAFLQVSLPLLTPGVISGAILAFMISFDDVTAPIFLSGVAAGTLPKSMMEALQLDNDPSVMAASTVIALIGLALFAIGAFTARARR